MTSLRKLGGVSILLIFIFMIIALFQFQKEEDIPLLPEQSEYYFNEDWSMISLDSTKVSGAELNDSRVQKLIKETLKEGKYQKVNLPYTGKSEVDDIIVFKNILPKEFAGLALKFSSIDTMICIILDGKIIYQSYFEDDVSKRMFGYNEHLVNIPNVIQKGEIWIELTSSYPDVAATLDNIKIETRDMIMIGVIGNHITDIGCCLLIIIMTIIMFVLTLIRRYTCQPTRGELFLALIGLTTGIYYFIDTNTLSIFYNIQEAYAIQEYLVLLLPLFLTLYFERNLYIVYPRRFSILLCCVCIH